MKCDLLQLSWWKILNVLLVLLLVKVFLFKTCGQQMLSLLVMHGLQWSYFLLLFLLTILPSNIFLLSIRSLRFLFRLYPMIGSCSNVVLIFEFICNKFQCLLIICFTFRKVLLYVITKGTLFVSTLVIVIRLSQFLIIVEIMYLEIFR